MRTRPLIGRDVTCVPRAVRKVPHGVRSSQITKPRDLVTVTHNVNQPIEFGVPVADSQLSISATHVQLIHM